MIDFTRTETIFTPITRMDITKTDYDDISKTIGTLSAIIIQPELVDFDAEMIMDSLEQVLSDDTFDPEECIDVIEPSLLITKVSANASDRDKQIDIYVDMVGKAFETTCQICGVGGMDVFLVDDAARELHDVSISLEYGSKEHDFS